MISVMGMGLTFTALGLLILTMNLLERFSPGGAQPPVSIELAPHKKPATNAAARDTEAEVATAIAVALVYLREADALRAAEVHHAGLGARLEAGRGLWWMAGRTQQRSANAPRTIRWRN
jgi:Na+-transporting methylmalonyl-CoA/oxaloacetate decarboxylase gamma subunit